MMSTQVPMESGGAKKQKDRCEWGDKMWGFSSGVGQVSLLTASFKCLVVCITCDFMSVHLNRTNPGTIRKTLLMT